MPRFTEKPRYYNLLLSAWEQRHGGLSREAGRLVLEQLCRNKHHLKVGYRCPTVISHHNNMSYCHHMLQVPANVYVKKTAAGQQAIDISGLEAPTSAAAAASAKPCCDGESEVLSCEDSEVGGVKNN